MTELTLTAEGDRHVVATRRFAAAPERLYEAHTDCVLIRQWMLGPEGWSMPSCQCDPRPGGSFRYEWVDGQGGGFHFTGEFLEVEPPHRILHVERMHMPEPTPDYRVETTFEPDGDAGTLLTLRMTFQDRETRDTMVEMGMADGMAASYDRLEELG